MHTQMIESLEGRRLLADVGVATNGSGLLMITGSDDADQVSIVGNSTSLRVRPLPGTTLNGQAAFVDVPKTQVRSIYVTLGGGNDGFSLSYVDAPIGGTIEGDDGDDEVILWGTNLATLLVRGGEGNDRLGFVDNYGGNLIVEGDAGDDLIDLRRNTLAGYASIAGGTGDDDVTFAGNTLGSFGYLSGNDGVDKLRLVGNLFNGGSYIPGFETTATTL